MICAASPVSAGHGPRASARWIRLLAAVVFAAAGVSAGAMPFRPAVSARADEVTISGNNLRNGWDSAETTGSLTPATLKGGTFGALFSARVDGQVYAQPIAAGGTLIVATESDWVYGLSAQTGAVQWSRSLGAPWPSSAGNCNDLKPSVGVTGTPVYDPGSGLVYLVSEDVPAGHTASQPAFYLNALDAGTGQQAPGWPVQIKGAPVNNPTVPFNAFTQLQRPGLLLTGGAVYAAFGSHCDFVPYEGYVAGVNTASGKLTMWSDEAGLTDTQAGIWQSGGGLMSDGTGRMFLASGNGISPPPGPGSRPPSELAESVVRLAVQNDGSLAAKDFFSPANAPYLDQPAVDGDLGSGAPVGLPFGTPALPHLLLQAGKLDGLYLLNRDNLGGREQGPNKTDAAVSRAGQSLPGQWGHPAAFADTGVLTTANVGASRDYVYYLGKNDTLRYFKAGLGGPSGVTPVLTDVASSTGKFGYTSGSPVVTSNGTNRSTAVVWVVNASDEFGTTGRLQAFPAMPPGTCTKTKPCAVPPLWTSAPFSGAGKFTTAAADSGRVYVGTRGVLSDGSNCGAVPSGHYCGQVLGFGSPSKAPLGGASPVNFGDVAVGSTSGARKVTVTDTQASGTVKVNSVTASGAGFAVAGPFDYTPMGGTAAPATLPVVLNPGDKLTAEGVTLAPAAPGGANGSVQFATGSANFPVVGVGLSGIGTQKGFYAASSSVSFDAVPAGTSARQQLTVTNGESLPETLTAATPGAPFTVSGLPSSSLQIQPGQTVLLTATYLPSAAGTDTDSLTLTGDDGTVQTQTVIALSGQSVADIVPTLTGTGSLDFGSVPLGKQATKTVTITNSGNLPAVITGSTALPLPYGTPEPITAGLPVNPGAQYLVHVPVTFTPTSLGTVTSAYQVTWTDVAGTHTLKVPLTGTGVAPVAGIAVPPPGGGWRFNGSARMTGANLSLTQLKVGQVGSAVYSMPVPSGGGLKATFTAQLSGGTGADGLTFALLDADQTTPAALGGAGAELGFGGQSGVAVTLDTFKDGPNYPSNSFVGVATGAQNGLLTFARTANVPGLRGKAHVVGVSVAAGTVTVTVDGKRVLSKAVTLPPSLRLAFTGANGAKTDDHVVSKVTITAAGHRMPPPGGGWSYNGTATTAGSDTRLTPALASKAGSVVYPVPVQAAGLRVTFNAQLGGGTGGDGLTLSLLNPATTTTRTLGLPGLMVGLGTRAGVPGTGIVLATGGGTSPLGFVGTSVQAGSSGLRYQRVARAIGSLLSGTHTVRVSVSRQGGPGDLVTIFLDGVRVLAENEPTMTSTVRLAFTAGTGKLNDVHIVRTVAIAASG